MIDYAKENAKFLLMRIQRRKYCIIYIQAIYLNESIMWATAYFSWFQYNI